MSPPAWCWVVSIGLTAVFEIVTRVRQNLPKELEEIERKWKAGKK